MPVLREKRFLRVKLDMVGRCQLRCIMCHFAHPDFVENPVTMGGELLEKVANDLFPRAHDVVLSSSAEPLLAPDLPRALELCREHDVPNFHFSTNGVSMTQRIVDKVIDVRMPCLTISIDAGTKETFERIRTPAKWDKVMRAFDLVNEGKARRGSDLPVLTVTAVLMRSNIREMPTLVRLMHEKGVAQMNFVHMGVIGGLGVEHESLLNEPALCNRTLEEVRAVADELGMQVVIPLPIPEDLRSRGAAEGGADPSDVIDAERSEGGANGHTAIRLDDEDEEDRSSFSVAEFLNHKNVEFNLKARRKDHHNRPCYFPWYYLHVNPDGTVFPCGSWFEFSSMGDFRTQSFREIWTGQPLRELRHQLVSMELRDVCANCSVSNMGRPDVIASFSHRAKVKRARRDEAAADGATTGSDAPGAPGNPGA